MLSGTAHLHGSCHGGTQGGIQQTFSTTALTSYTLTFSAFAGLWDGADTDYLEVMIENSDQSEWVQFSVAQDEWEGIAHRFIAYNDVNIIIWSDADECIDVDDIELINCGTGDSHFFCFLLL